MLFWMKVPRGVEVGEVREGRVLDTADAVGRPFQGAVVEGDGYAVGGERDVDVDDVATHRDAVFVRIQRVLGEQRVAAGVRYDERATDPKRIVGLAISRPDYGVCDGRRLAADDA